MEQARPSMSFPIFLNLRGRLCTIIGGGEVAARKAAALLREEACVRVVAPELSDEMKALLVSPHLTHVSRAYQEGDLEGSALAFAATNEADVNAAVYQEAESTGIPVNVADDPAHCTFFMPAAVHRDPITIAISTEGCSPALARHLRRKIEEAVPPAYAHLARLLGRLRPELMAAVAERGQRKERLERVVNSEVLSLLFSGRFEEAEQLARSLLGLDT